MFHCCVTRRHNSLLTSLSINAICLIIISTLRTTSLLQVSRIIGNHIEIVDIYQYIASMLYIVLINVSVLHTITRA